MISMAAMSAAPAGTTTLTPPSSSHGNQASSTWNYAASGHAEGALHDKKLPPNNDAANRTPLLAQNGNTKAPMYDSGVGLGTTTTTTTTTSRKMSSGESTRGRTTIEMGYMSPPYGADSTSKAAGSSPADSVTDVYGSGKTGQTGDKRSAAEYPAEPDDDNSKWIHRDKLARIESEELQAAGIILPTVRAQSRPRANKSSEKLNGYKRTTVDTVDLPISQPQPQPQASSQPQPMTPRPRKNSIAAEKKVQDIEVPPWDLRTPDEIAAELQDSYWTSNGGLKGASKIPVAKVSPVPIPYDYIERDSPSVRKQTDIADENSIAFPKPRTRSRSNSMKALEPTTSNSLQPAKRTVSNSDLSPKKGGNQNQANRKGSAPAKAGGAAAAAAVGGNAPAGARPKTRGGPNKDSTSSSGTRPSTRSGELSPGTGGFGNSKQPEGDPPWMVSAYRPDPRLPPDQQLLPTVARRLQQEKWEREGKFGSVLDKEFRPLTDDGFLKPPETSGENGGSSDGALNGPGPNLDLDWPLKPEPQKSPTRQGRSYSTMPKISDKPPMSPLPSPGTQQPQGQVQQETQQITRLPDLPDEQTKRKGCGCCIVM